MICEWVLLISFSKNYSRINTIELHSNMIGKFLTWNFFKESSSFFGIFHSNVFNGTLENQEVLGIDIDAQLFKFLQIGWRTDYVSINSVFCRGTYREKKQKFSLIHKLASRWRTVSKIFLFTFPTFLRAPIWVEKTDYQLTFAWL